MAEVSRSVSLSSSSNKLPSITGLTSSTHIYDDVFSSPARRRSSSSSFSPRFEDYSEIFGAASPIASYSTSIPILDLPIADETGNLSGDRSSGNVDYSGIFGGYRGDDSDVVSYEELVIQSTKRRSPAQSLTSRKESDGNSQNIQPSSNGSSCQSISNVKHVNIAYNKTSQMSKDGVNGTIHIAHLNAVPGFTYSFDEVGPPGKTGNNATTPVMTNDAKPSGYFNADKNQGNHYRKTRSDLGAKQAGQPAAGSHYRKTSYDLGANKQAGEHDAVSHYRKASFDFGANKQAGKHGAGSGLSGSYPFDASRNTGENNVKANPSKMLPPMSPKVVATNGTDDSKDGGNGTVHAAHFNAVPGFDFSFDDVGPPGKTGSSATTPAVNDAKSSKQGKHSRKSSSDLGASKQAGERGDRSGVSGSHPTDSSCNACGTNMKAKLSKMVPPATPSTVASNVSDDSMPMKSFPGVSKNNLYKGAGGDTSPPLLDEQLDVNSVAAASAAALKRAIEEAETQIRLAKELLERKGGQGSSKLTFKDILKSKAPKKKAYVNGTYVAEDKKLHQSSPQVDSSKQSSTVLKWLDASETTQVIPLIENRTIICSDAEPREETTANESKTSQECYKREGGGEWEATKHFSYFINGVKNKIASFMTKQVDSEQKVEQKETTMVSEPVAQSQEGGSGIEVEDLDVEQETDTKHGATMSYKEHELDVDKSCMVPEVIESEENELHSGAHLEHVNGGELRGSADLVQGKIHEEVSVDAQEHMEEQIDFPESKEEEKKVEVLETGEHEVGNRQEVVIDDVEDLIEEAGEPDELGLDNFCVRQGLQMGLVDADKQEDNDKSLEEPCYMIAHEEKVPSNGEETSKMLDLSPVQEMASTEKIIGDYHDTENSVDELKEDSYLEAREMLEESDIQQESEEIPKEASPMEEIGISAEGKEEVHRWEEDMKIQKQNSETGETAVPLQATVEAVECDRYVLASDSVCKQAEDTFLDRSSACSDDGCETSVGGDASFVSIDDPTKPAVVEAANELIEEEMVQPSIPVEGDAGLRRNGHMTINSPSETVDNVEEPVLREVANELEAEETVQSSVSDEDNAGFVGIGKEINDTESGIPSGEVLLSQHGTDVNFEQENADKASEQGECLGSEIDEPEDSDRKPEESKFEGSLVNEPESLLRDSAQIENARAEDMACDQEGLKENIESIHQEGQKQNVESVHRRRRWFENTEKVVAPERPSIMEEDGIAVEPNHDNAEGPESGGSVEIHAGKMVSDSEEGETVREADVITEQRRPNLEATPKRRRWFVNREEVGVTQRPSLFGGDEVSGEINHESEKESKLDNSLENCVDKLVGGSGEASDMGRADVGVNADRDIPSVEATPRRKRWFENGEKVVAARRLNILASDGATLETERGSKTEENIVKQEHIDRTPMISKGVDKNNHVEQGNQLQGDADEVIRRGREKEKEKLAVERAIREARERAFTEARERAKRDAMERPTAGASQRAGVAPQDRPGKAFGESKSFPDKVSMDAKLRAERAAVERATAEARERALQKALSEKAAHKSREQLQDPRQQNSAGNCSSRFSESSNSDNAASGESAQRHKAILERHGRTMERAAKALEEKNMRDLLVQKEQAERNRLANALDAEVKRWSSGKEGNLRALLSTLQYILGSDSGWQPISLTDLVAVASVRKAYKKATLCVHPDKLQQRGANIQQKYICEKVFDLLKDAWGKFNRDERW